MKPVIIEPEAETDLAEACDWYEKQRAGLSADFLLCVEAAIDSANHRPGTFPFIHSLTRRVLVRRFPYIVLFQDRPKATVVLGVFHARQDPKRKRRRSR